MERTPDIVARLRDLAKSLRNLAPMWKGLYAEQADRAFRDADSAEEAANLIERLRASQPLAAEVDPRSRNADTQVEPGGEKIG